MTTVLHIHTGNMFGGIEAVLLTLHAAAGTDPAAPTQHLALCFDGVLRSTLRDRGASVHDLGRARWSRPWTIRRVRRHLERTLAEVRPDAALVHSPWSQAVFGPVLRRWGGPAGLWLHGPPTGRHWLERKAQRIPPTRLIANSAYTAEHAHHLYADLVPAVVHPPVAAHTADPGARVAWRTRGRTGTDDVVILHPGRWEAGKGQRELITALAVLRNHPGWTAWFASTPHTAAERRYHNSVRRAAAAHGLADRVRFLGHVDHMAEVYAAADLLCQPNTSPESFGVVFVEALYAGLPVVTPPIGGANEILRDDVARFVARSDVTDLAHTLRDLLDDPNVRQAVAESGPRRAAAVADPRRQLHRLMEALDLEPTA